MDARKLKRSATWLALFVLAAASASRAAEHEVIFLWPNGAPGSEGKTAPETTRITPEGDHVVSSVNRPSITVYLPPKEIATGAAVVICPGGGHVELWMDHEGYNVGQWLSEHGVAGFVLKYRLARAKGSTYTVEGDALHDVQRAIRLVRSRAAEWGIDPERVGVIGFSAGGQVAALAATRYNASNAGAADPIDRENSRPAFQALIYPGPLRDVHIDPASLPKETPQAFLLCGEDDRPDISQGLAELYLALKRAGAAAELHVYTGVGHGFGMRSSNQGPIAAWPERFLEWMEARGLLKRK
ncbi:MAG TPA: alpha/beta hydrolase [Candidatus Acidoferrum sp.]|nr:alpha/beta hydrolase [Candidatus Acidoferrum sp.]